MNDEPRYPNLDSYLLPNYEAENWTSLLAKFSTQMPSDFRMWFVNCFGDVFFFRTDNSVAILDMTDGEVRTLANDRTEFVRLADIGGNANDWLLISLVDELRAAGKQLKSRTCYSFVKPPIIGGDFAVENVAVIPLDEFYSYHADLFEQIRKSPDGAEVVLVPINVPDRGHRS